MVDVADGEGEPRVVPELKIFWSLVNSAGPGNAQYGSIGINWASTSAQVARRSSVAYRRLPAWRAGLGILQLHQASARICRTLL